MPYLFLCVRQFKCYSVLLSVEADEKLPLYFVLGYNTFDYGKIPRQRFRLRLGAVLQPTAANELVLFLSGTGALGTNLKTQWYNFSTGLS